MALPYHLRMRPLAAALGAVAVLGAALPAFSDGFATVTVCATGCTYTSIQAAVDAASNGDIIQVKPGTYTETRAVTAAEFPGFGPNSYGLFVHKSVTIQGVDASGNVITDPNAVQATVVAGANAGFGAMNAIYADNVTIEGLGFKPKSDYRNKTVEVWGDNLTFRNNVVDSRGKVGGVNGAGLYIGEWTQDAPWEISSFTISGNRFLAGGITLTNGAGTDANTAGRVISGNTFDSAGEDNFAGLAFTGRMPEIAWRLNQAGAATVTGNSFLGYGFDSAYNYSANVLVRGEMTTPVSLAQILADNTFDRAAMVLDGATARSFSYDTGNGLRNDGFALRAPVTRGIAEAQAGDKVLFKGTHVTTTSLEIAKSITLEGSGTATATIDARSSNGYSLRTSVSNVTLKGFTLLGATNTSGAAYGIKMEGATTSAKTTGLVVEDVTVTGPRKTGLDINGADGVTITNVTVTGTTNGRGIALTDVDNATLTGITTSGNMWGGVSIATYGRYAPLGSSNVTIVSQTSAEINPIDFDLSNFADVNNPSIPVNFTGPAGYNNYTVKRPLSGSFTLWSLTPSEANAKTLAQGSPGSSIVTASGDVLVFPGMSLQAAIDATPSGGTLNVPAGTYTGAISLNKSVKLVGAGTDASTGTVIASASGPVVTLSGSGTAADPITLQNLRISAPQRHGINVPASSGTVAHVLLDGIHVVGNSPTTNYEDSGLWVDAAASLTNLTVRDSRFANMQYGWYFQKHGSWTGGSTVANVTVERTVFDGNMGKGIYAEKLSDATFTDVSVTNNGLNPTQFNAPWNAGVDINLKSNDVAYQNIAFVNPTITGNAVAQQYGVGMTIKARSDGSTYGVYPAALNGVTITGGTVSGNGAGIRIGEPGKANPGPTGVTITGVYFGDNLSTHASNAGLNRALINESKAAVVAENNWWGSADPAVVASRIVNTSTGSVDYTPWLGQAVATSTPVVNTPLPVSGTPATFTFTTLPANPQGLSVVFEPVAPQSSSAALPNPAASIPGATSTLPATLTVTSPMANYTFRTTVSLDVSAIPGFGPDTRVAYYNTLTNSYVPIEGAYAAGSPATFSFETDHFTTFVFYNGSAADPMDLYVSRTTAVPAVGEEFVTPDGSWSDLGNDADDWTYTGQAVTFNVVPGFPAAFGGLSSMSLVYAYDPAVMTYTGATFNGDWGFSQCQNGVPSAGRITCDLSTLNAASEVLTTMAGAAMSLSFTSSGPGYSVLDIVGADVRKLDGAGGYEGVAVTTHGGGLRAYLGDVVARTGASTTDVTKGDGKVDFDDLTVFTQSYWAGVSGYTGSAVYRDKADIGPTTGARARTVYGIPSLDRKVDFEDLVIFAASYGLSGRNVYQSAQPGISEQTQGTQEAVRVVAGTVSSEGDRFVVPVELSSVDELRGGSFALQVGSGVEVVGVRFKGSLAGDRDGLAFARAEGNGLVRVDAAVLGQEGLAGAGALVEVVLRASSAPNVQVASADLRDAMGGTIPSLVSGTVAVDDAPLPTELALESVYPNPARQRATVRVAIPTAQAVNVRVYDALGREVLRVHEGDLAAGRHELPLATDGLANGRYIVRMQAGSLVRSGTLTVLR